MRYKGRKTSKNVDDRRGQKGGAGTIGAGFGLGGIIIVIIFLLLGQNPMALLEQVGSGGGASSSPSQNTGVQQSNAQTDELAEFVGVVLQDTEDVWNKLFMDEYRADYEEPDLVLFENRVNTACGGASSASGPFYCPGDKKVYIDLGFYDQLKNQFGAGGDFAMAYVVAHEVGHHIQKLLGITDEIHGQKRRLSEKEYNKLSVKLELQADFLAGVWTHHNQRMNNILEEGDIEEALRAANAIGDDAIQKKSRGYVIPHAFTHGTSEQRMRWFTKGWKTGDLDQGNTFDIPYNNL